MIRESVMIWIVVVGIPIVLLIFLVSRFYCGKHETENIWKAAEINKIENVGKVKSIEILPLIDWYADREGLRGGAGVSYLIKTDTQNVLFDAGHDESVLSHNMSRLGLTVNDFDVVVVSHNHFDHTSGLNWISQETSKAGLGEKRMLFPVFVNIKGFKTEVSEKPTAIAEGIATIGAIANYDIFMGRIVEQALAINVEGKGIVLVVGCGHQGLPRILERTESLFDQPLYGIIGGLHYPVTDSRAKSMGIRIQKYMATCRPPWDPLTMETVKTMILTLKEKNPKIVALSAHDSCDAVIDEFRRAFGEAYVYVKVGKKIII
jgi:7,8-dihydropterin-6-yl-methyl-4-(beta-D-ribofuranosyl)aminobenzene 5'-phosphate synthase